MSINSLTEPYQLKEIVNRLRSKGMMLLAEGSLSLLDDDANIYITPSEIEMLNPDPDEMLFFNSHFNRDKKTGNNLEISIHEAIYESRKDIRAICHAYSPALAVISSSYNQGIFSVHPRLQKMAGLTHFSEYVTEESEDAISSFISRFRNGASNVILDNAGVITTGRTILEAYQKIETLNHLAQAIIKADKIGELNFPNDENQKFFNYFVPQKCESLRGRRISEDFSKKKKDLLNIISNAYNNDLITATSGSFSVRVADKSFYISPKGNDKCYLRTDDLVFVNNNKAGNSKVPDDNVWVHNAIYKSARNVGAVAIVIPTDIAAYAFLDLLPEMAGLKITRTPFSTIGNAELLANLVLSGYHALLIENDMLLVTAKSIPELSKRLELIGFSSKTRILSEAIF